MKKRYLLSLLLASPAILNARILPRIPYQWHITHFIDSKTQKLVGECNFLLYRNKENTYHADGFKFIVNPQDRGQFAVQEGFKIWCHQCHELGISKITWTAEPYDVDKNGKPVYYHNQPEKYQQKLEKLVWYYAVLGGTPKRDAHGVVIVDAPAYARGMKAVTFSFDALEKVKQMPFSWKQQLNTLLGKKVIHKIEV